MKKAISHILLNTPWITSISRVLHGVQNFNHKINNNFYGWPDHLIANWIELFRKDQSSGWSAQREANYQHIVEAFKLHDWLLWNDKINTKAVALQNMFCTNLNNHAQRTMLWSNSVQFEWTNSFFWECNSHQLQHLNVNQLPNWSLFVFFITISC